MAVDQLTTEELSDPSGNIFGVDATDRSLVEHALQLLALDGPVSVGDRLGGGSGARVFGTRLGTSDAVLKVTADPGWRSAAVRELLVHQNPALEGFRPRLLASALDDDVVALLTERGEALPEAPDPTAWSRIAHRLGRLHAAMPTDAPVALPRGDAADAVSTWERAGAGPAARFGVEKLDVARAISASADTVLGHGDCHLDNLVLIEGEPSWIDWQQTHPGPGYDDLVFCWQRAEFAGLQPPRDAMSLAYAAGRGIAADHGFRCQLAAAELQLLLLAWPPHLGYGDVRARQRMAERLQKLVDDPTWSSGACAA